MTSNEASRFIDRAEVEGLIKQAHSNRAQYIRNNIRYVIWTAGSVGAVCALALAGLVLSGTPKTPVAHHISYLK